MDTSPFEYLRTNQIMFRFLQQAVPAVGFQKPPGLQDSAPKPQVPGRHISDADISESLCGRIVEMYWPDDSKWYLVVIQHVDVVNKKGTAMYTTGENEELDLSEVVRDKHIWIPA